MVCCGQPMTELVPGTSDAAVEKHVPEVTLEGSEVFVQVGTVAHPMISEHHIQFIWIETAKGAQVARLEAGDRPEAHFIMDEGDKLENVYAYCNLHGLWKAEML